MRTHVLVCTACWLLSVIIHQTSFILLCLRFSWYHFAVACRQQCILYHGTSESNKVIVVDLTDKSTNYMSFDT